MKRLIIAAALSATLALGCSSSGTREQQLADMAWEFGDGAITLRDIAALYEPTRPDLTQRLLRLASDVEAVGRTLQALSAGTGDSEGALAQIDAVLGIVAGTAWTDDAKTQTDIQAAVIVARAILRRAAHTIDPARPVEQ